MATAVIAVGSNIEPERNIALAQNMIREQLHFIAASRFVKTTPRGFTDQPDFINGACRVETEMTIDELKKYLKSVEQRLGRKRTANSNGPRTIDLDVVVYDGQIVDDDFYKYNFVRTAVLELEPELQKRNRGKL